MHVAVDLDDVVLDFCGGLVTAMNTEHAAGLTIEDIQEWDLSVILDPIIGRSWWDWLRERDWLWSNFGAIEGAIGGLEKLRRDGHYLECVTSKPQWAEASVWKWLGKWRPPFQAVTIVGVETCKVDFTDAAVLIDDKPKNVAQFADASRYGILYNRPHNVNTKVETEHPWAYERAFGWGHVYDIITEQTQEA